jgi:hypothetical protein
MSTDDMYGVDDGADRTDSTDEEGRMARESRQVCTLMQLVVAAADDEDAAEALDREATDLATEMSAELDRVGASRGEATMALWKLAVTQWDDEMPHYDLDVLLGADRAAEERSRFQADARTIIDAVSSAVLAAREADDTSERAFLATASDHAETVQAEVLADRSLSRSVLVMACWRLLLSLAEE